MSMTMSIVNGELHMPLDMNGMPRCRGSNGVNFGGQCWWTSVSGSPLGTHCKYCLAELDKRIEALLPGLTGSSPDSMPPKWGWL